MNDAGIKPAARGRSLPLRLKVAAHEGAPAHERVLRGCFRLGYAKDCDIQLLGGDGPGVLFEVENARGPLLIARALPPQECANYVDVRIDGEPLAGSQQTLNPGARVAIIDKATQRRYEMVVDSQLPHPWFRPRNLAAVIMVLALLGSAFGGYLYRSLTGTRSEVQRASERMGRAEETLQRTVRELRESVSQMGTTDAELASTIRELNHLQGAASLELREEFSQRMVSTYQQLNEVKHSLLDTMAQRFAARGPPRSALKSVLTKSRDAVLFVRTRYRVTFAEDAESRELTGFGSAFLVDAEGLALTAQHVMYPWRYDQELLVLTRLGLAQVDTDSVRWSVWVTGRTVLEDPADPDSFHEEDAYHSYGDDPKLQVLAVAEPKLTQVMVASPLGMIELAVPLPGRNDIAVFQIDSADAQLAHLRLAKDVGSVGPLDEVLAIGYPYSRLTYGRALPQGVQGLVRRIDDELLEIDAAVHPGLSGGPLISLDGEVIGMISASLGSDVYGVAVLVRDLRTVLGEARAQD